MHVHGCVAKMVLDIGESGLVLESSAKAMAGLPTQSFAVSLSGSLIEDMIACVQNGGGIQLALGASPVSTLLKFLPAYCLLSGGAAQ